MNKVQIDSRILEKWLTCGVIFDKILTPTKEGTPQGEKIIHFVSGMIFLMTKSRKIWMR